MRLYPQFFFASNELLSVAAWTVRSLDRQPLPRTRRRRYQRRIQDPAIRSQRPASCPSVVCGRRGLPMVRCRHPHLRLRRRRARTDPGTRHDGVVRRSPRRVLFRKKRWRAEAASLNASRKSLNRASDSGALRKRKTGAGFAACPRVDGTNRFELRRRTSSPSACGASGLAGCELHPCGRRPEPLN